VGFVVSPMDGASAVDHMGSRSCASNHVSTTWAPGHAVPTPEDREKCEAQPGNRACRSTTQ
jgi:hypothetical protein